MKNILLFGAGKSATELIEYLINESQENEWNVTIADANKSLIDQKTNNSPFAKSVELDINNTEKRKLLIQSSDIVISMMPPTLHILIAKDCIAFGKSLLTASYADDEIKSLEKQVIDKGLLFLCEMGLDPGIDHMSAMQLLDEIKEMGGEVSSFKSHCGGLVAPESDDNPWHYKISWNPRNVVLAGKAGAIYKENNQIIDEKYEKLFDGNRYVMLENNDNSIFSYYPNRNSLPYIELYDLPKANTFIRTTLRHADFMHGWKNLIDLHLTDETPSFQSDGKSLRDFFKEHLNNHGFNQWLDVKLSERFLESSNLILKQLFFLGLEDNETIINKGFCSPADILQLALEKKLALLDGDKDMIVMLHEIEYQHKDKTHFIKSSLVVKGDDHIHTAMAKTVGLPLGIAAKLILNGLITTTGIQIPIIKEIYNPVLDELKKYGIEFKETRY